MISFIEYYSGRDYNFARWYLLKTLVVSVDSPNKNVNHIFLGEYFKAEKFLNNMFRIISGGNTNLKEGDIIRIKNPDNHFYTFINKDDVIKTREEIFK
jgi:hypothetical protein